MTRYQIGGNKIYDIQISHELGFSSFELVRALISLFTCLIFKHFIL